MFECGADSHLSVMRWKSQAVASSAALRLNTGPTWQLWNLLFLANGVYTVGLFSRYVTPKGQE